MLSSHYECSLIEPLLPNKAAMWVPENRVKITGIKMFLRSDMGT
jgi:hypothetical protein